MCSNVPRCIIYLWFSHQYTYVHKCSSELLPLPITLFILTASHTDSLVLGSPSPSYGAPLVRQSANIIGGRQSRDTLTTSDESVRSYLLSEGSEGGQCILCVCVCVCVWVWVWVWVGVGVCGCGCGCVCVVWVLYHVLAFGALQYK